jgi:hypothetical protein
MRGPDSFAGFLRVRVCWLKGATALRRCSLTLEFSLHCLQFMILSIGRSLQEFPIDAEWLNQRIEETPRRSGLRLVEEHPASVLLVGVAPGIPKPSMDG